MSDSDSSTEPLIVDVPIVLNELEKKIFATIREAADTVFPEKHVVMRVAGGWVRDKVLGLSSHDIDIALDTMMGAEFAEGVRSIIDKDNQGKTTKIGVIKQNPEQSKHLETATMMVHGLLTAFPIIIISCF